MKKKLSLLLLSIFTLPVLAFSQKAYESIYYTGKTQNITVKFTLANGYIGACEVKTTDNKTKKSSKFLPENGYAGDDKKMKFYHYSATGKTFTDYFIIEGMEEVYESIPAKIYGNYYFNGTAYKITFTKL
jgi:hypothetical protein